MRVVVFGGAGFLGSHLCALLLGQGDRIVCLDDLTTGREDNVRRLADHPGFTFVQADVSAELPELPGPVDAVVHLASPASPPDYLRFPLKTLAAGSRGTENGLRLALRHGARFLLGSTSEVYGDPTTHPQSEDYWGNVNPVGPRSVYDEAKRFSEALTASYARELGVNTGIVRIFNTYGPRMRRDDGRVIPNLVGQALSGAPLTVYGRGDHTRSFCFVDDLVRGVRLMLRSAERGPVNLGNPEETTIDELARTILRITGSASPVEHLPLPVDDPVRRSPDITAARALLGWSPAIGAEEGLARTVDWFAGQRSPVVR
ncbi:MULTISPECIES: NAD-dependent epimerase/dehydratase family protein [unclassified Streptomyces]|uniref:NAD-dependent epimerase/dehydratase family protein n=1 Tax=unclassified Streptomyces TaxID=2593676 RepID=UPI001906AA0D|nr:NAD-dependent epimerase/dehydratase family protein [Streptomyces sp. HSG2]